MKLLTINESNYGSTGKLMYTLARNAHCNFYMAVSNSRSNKKSSMDNCTYIGTRIGRNIHLKLFEFTGLNGCFSIIDTLLFLIKVKKYKPDIIHLHNLHNCFINLPLLFKYLKSTNVRVIWTLHDCWSFTGQCPHFITSGCKKWKTGCFECKRYRLYPSTRADRTAFMWNNKRKWFSGLKNITIVTPSKWLANMVKESFLSKYDIRVIPNGVDVSVFKNLKSDFREKHNINSDDIMLLGVSYEWTDTKGLDVFLDLANRLDSKYHIVLVGTDNCIDKIIPDNIISIHRTNNAMELAAIYSAADIFINPTREDTFPTVNMEAICCGAKVITFDVGGCKETIDKQVGCCVPINRIDLLIEEIEGMSNKEVQAQCFHEYRKEHDMNICIERYMELYYESKK